MDIVDNAKFATLRILVQSPYLKLFAQVSLAPIIERVGRVDAQLFLAENAVAVIRARLQAVNVYAVVIARNPPSDDCFIKTRTHLGVVAGAVVREYGNRCE